MIDNTQIAEIMTKEVVLVEANDLIREIEDTFGNYSLRHAPVLSDGELVGMISLVDIQRVNDSPLDELVDTSKGLVARSFMTPNPISVQLSATIREVATLFIEQDFHAIPVLDGDKIVGIVTTTDIIRYFLEEE